MVKLRKRKCRKRYIEVFEMQELVRQKQKHAKRIMDY